MAQISDAEPNQVFATERQYRLNLPMHLKANASKEKHYQIASNQSDECCQKDFCRPQQETEWKGQHENERNANKHAVKQFARQKSGFELHYLGTSKLSVMRLMMSNVRMPSISRSGVSWILWFSTGPVT